ncbi:MAG: DNA primase [Muribaculaceae bacterium]|nr:DNA primase [Muribaculaceae bacterium]
MIDRATVERIKETADIVDVVGDYVHLIRRGSNYMGLCPFHNERTPSFSVNKAKNFCYCFSCKKGGSPVNFIMEKEGLSYHEALLHLARKYGIEVVEREVTDEERARQSLREAMFVANEWAMRKMEEDMWQTDEGRDVGLQYLTERGVTDAAIKAFHLGYALDRGNNLTEAARKAGFQLDILKQLGLIGTSQQGRDYDRFRGRVIFPILNTAGKVIAFGGRDLKGGLAKYINSPESELYKKSNELYGIFQAKSAIVSEGKCFLVEGYMDVIGMWQSGMKNVVASSGTALTDGQIAMIHRFTENITLIYDGDAAGIKASLRGIDMLLSHKLNVKVLLLPDGDDPDSFARKHTPEDFKAYVAEHETDIIRFKAQVLLDTVKSDPQKRISAINSVVESIAHIPDPVSRDVYVQECSIILGVPEATVARSVSRARRLIVENIKNQRTLKSYPDTPATNNAPTMPVTPRHEPSQTSQTVSPETAGNTEPTTAPQNDAARMQINPVVMPLEREVIKYCVRYAYLPFCSYEIEDNTNGGESGTRVVNLDVAGFVEDELSQSEMDFTVPLFKKTFELIKGMRDAMTETLSRHRINSEKKYQELRAAAYQEIAGKGLSIPEIEREEKKIETTLNEQRKAEEHGVIKEYAVKHLCSHEDDEIRKFAMDISFERHHLSNIYVKTGNAQLEEDKLSVLVVRAIDEWKNELINQRINEIFRKMREIVGKGDIEKEQQLQAELTSIYAIRSQMARIIGDRTLFNRKV